MPEQWGDAVILRKDVPASYHLAVVVDDARQGITHVTRGRDLFQATGLHRLLQVLLGLPEPLYQHHRLLVDADGRKLAKSAATRSWSAARGWCLARRRATHAGHVWRLAKLSSALHRPSAHSDAAELAKPTAYTGLFRMVSASLTIV